MSPKLPEVPRKFKLWGNRCVETDPKTGEILGKFPNTIDGRGKCKGKRKRTPKKLKEKEKKMKPGPGEIIVTGAKVKPFFRKGKKVKGFTRDPYIKADRGKKGEQPKEERFFPSNRMINLSGQFFDVQNTTPTQATPRQAIIAGMVAQNLGMSPQEIKKVKSDLIALSNQNIRDDPPLAKKFIQTEQYFAIGANSRSTPRSKINPQWNIDLSTARKLRIQSEQDAKNLSRKIKQKLRSLPTLRK